MRKITSEEINTYKEDGVVLIKSILSLSEIEELDSVLWSIVPDLERSHLAYDAGDIAEKLESRNLPVLRDSKVRKNAHGKFLSAIGCSSKYKDLWDFVTTSSLGELSAQLLESEKAFFYDDQVISKEPMTDLHTAFHQDAPYFHVDGEQVCVIWISPDQVKEDMGPMMYVRGSHKCNTIFRPNVFISQEPIPGTIGKLQPNIEANIDNYPIVSYCTEPGDVIVHHYRTLHGSRGNTSNKHRLALSARYCGDDAVYLYRKETGNAQLHQKHDKKDGEPIECEQFPQVWPVKN